MVLALLVFTFTQRISAEEEKYVLAVPMIEGFEETSFVSVIDNLGKAMGNKLGCSIETKIIGFKYGQRLIDLVRSEFEAGTADISYINGLELGDYLNKKEKGLDILFSLSMNKSTIEKSCFFTRIGEFKDVSELRGKKWLGAVPVMPRFLLYSNGFDEPIDKFFGEIGYMTDSPINVLVEALKNKDIDVISTYAHTMRLSGEMNKKPATIQPLYCSDYESTWVFVGNPKTNKKRMEQITQIMLRAHKDKDFNQFQFAFAMINGKFEKLDDKAIELIKKNAKLFEEKGWYKEEKEFYKKYYDK